jgi:hypothetical protein
MLYNDKHVTTMDALNTIFATTSEKVGGVISAAAITSPLWIQEIKPYSDVAALFAPILGCIYLSLQIGFKLWDRTRNDE